MSRKPRSEATTPPDFEHALGELEALITRLERGDLPLAESLSLFEQGVALTRQCHGALADAQQRVELLQKDAQGARTVPFDADADTASD